jgi:DNA-binding transcriptional regulator PaaX
VKPATEEFLYFLLWSAELLTRPTFRNLTDSFESWAYRQGLWRQLDRLEGKQPIERDPKSEPREPRAARDRLYRLTEAGRLHVLGGRDPQARWSRRWDGVWRLVIFDVPVAQNAHRKRLRRYLQDEYFGCLQDSLWVTPDAVNKEHQILAGGKVKVESLILIEGQPCAGESDVQIVSAGWDWERINSRYAQHLKVLADFPREAPQNKTAAQSLLRWAGAEREAWLAAIQLDPLLPERILPPSYLGLEAWRKRVDILAAARDQIECFEG